VDEQLEDGGVNSGAEDTPGAPDGSRLQRLPIFPLGTVLYPTVSLPLVVFEERYRAMMRDLLSLPEADRAFGVVAIREGYEVAVGGSRAGANTGLVGSGQDSAGHRSARQSSYRIGCEARLVRSQRQRDGGYVIETVGARRFRVHEVRTGGEYLTADVLPLGEPLGRTAAEAATTALSTFERYRQVVSAHRGAAVMVGELPTEPVELSYALSATVPLTLADRQALLEVPDAESRLCRLDDLLRAELSAVRAVPSLPATDVVRTAWSPN
jgi:Lon protease-like protein